VTPEWIKNDSQLLYTIIPFFRYCLLRLEVIIWWSWIVSIEVLCHNIPCPLISWVGGCIGAKAVASIIATA